MKRSQAKSLAWKLREGGKDMDAIAKALGEAGYIGRLGTALTAAGVRQMMGPLGVKKLKRKRRAPAAVAAATRVPKRPGDERIELIRAICAQESMKPSDRIAAILLLT